MKRNNISRICFVDTLYSLLIYILLCENKKAVDKTFFFFTNRVDRAILDRFDSKYVFNFNTNGGIDRWFHDIYYKLTLILRFRFVKKCVVYGNDCHKYSFLFLKYGNFNVIEDGIINNYQGIKLDNSTKKHITFFDKIRFLLFGGPFMKWGKDPSVKNIYLTGLAEIPNEIADKVRLIDTQKMFDNFEDKDYLNSIFGMDSSIIDIMRTRKIILFTQCFDGLVSEDEKIEIYTQILSKYNNDEILIKTHPRESTKYRDFFPNHIVIDKPIPIEILKLNGVSFTKAVTLFSLAALSFDSIDWYGNNVTPALKRFYKGNEVREPNAFL